MTEVDIAVLGRLMVTVRGEPVSLSRINARLLLRLLVSEGAPVTVEQLYRDVWSTSPGYRLKRTDRTSVQKRIGELRKLIDPSRPGSNSVVIQQDRGASFAYRLELPRDAVDCWRAADLEGKLRVAEPAVVGEAAHSALRLWRGDPYEDVLGDRVADEARQRWAAVRWSLQVRVLDAYVQQGMVTEAQQLGQELISLRPGDNRLSALMDRVRALPIANEHVLVQHTSSQSHVSVVIVAGDLFAWPDDDLVIGFTDTFDTATDGDVVIASRSAQGQLLDRVYRGDLQRLDQELDQYLSALPHLTEESSADKPQGKRVRYPLGTVAVLRQAERSVFCVAYSTMGNNLVARSSVADLRLSLTLLWEAAHRHGQFGDLTMPLVGTTLSRISEATHQELVELIVASFLEASRSLPICRTLRLVILPRIVTKLNIAALANALHAY